MVKSETKAETNVNETADEKKYGTPAERDISDLEKKIIIQVEYYFGNINLSIDKFLQEQIKLDDGWVPLETVLKFNRLATLSKEAEVILTAISKSTSGLVEISEDKTKIRRSPTVPLPERNEDARQQTIRTVYCKGFPLDSKLEELLEFFNKFENGIVVVMRKYKERATQSWHFKGSIFITFKTVDAADKFLKLESVKYKDVELTRMWIKDYIEFKRKQRLEERSKRQRNKSGGEGGDNKNAKEEGDEQNEEGGKGKTEEKEVKRCIHCMQCIPSSTVPNAKEEGDKQNEEGRKGKTEKKEVKTCIPSSTVPNAKEEGDEQNEEGGKGKTEKKEEVKKCIPSSTVPNAKEEGDEQNEEGGKGKTEKKEEVKKCIPSSTVPNAKEEGDEQNEEGGKGKTEKKEEVKKCIPSSTVPNTKEEGDESGKGKTEEKEVKK